MRTLAIIKPQSWREPNWRRLRAIPVAGRLIARYLESCPSSNPYGLFHVTFGEIAGDLGITIAEVQEAMPELARMKWADYDTEAEMVWVIDGAKSQLKLPLKKGDYQIRAANTWFENVSPNKFLAPFFDRYATALSLEAPRLDLDDSAIFGGTVPDEVLTEWFDVFVEQFPANRKVGGEAGRVAFRKAMHMQGEDHFLTMVYSLDNQKRSTQWRSKPETIPSMVRWLDEEQWTRELKHDPGVPTTPPPVCACAPLCRTPAEHSLRMRLNSKCTHDPKCTSMLQHYERSME